MRRLWLAGIAACSALWAEASTAAPVKVDGGFVQGIAEADLTVYEGIPFAAPPVGDLRWCLFNTPQFGFANANIGSPTAGRITSTIADNRSMQFALKLGF